MATLPYVTSTGNIERALRGIQSAATPERVTQDFVKTILKIPGGSGNQITAFLKKIGFVSTDGTPTDLYRRFRNSATAGAAAAAALRAGYAPLYRRNEYMHELPDEKLKGLIIEETGQPKDSNVAKMVFASIKNIKKFANWTGDDAQNQPTAEQAITLAKADPNDREIQIEKPTLDQGVGLNLSYTINLNLPATTDVAVFNAIFKSLKENLLKND